MNTKSVEISLALCFAVCVYFAEHDFWQHHRPKEERMFVDMTDAIWYALITMYTVGYGDQVRRKKNLT